MTIDDVTRGSVEPASAWEPIAAEIRGDPERGPARVYEALRDLVWRLVRASRPVDELIRWQDVCARAAAGIRAKRPALAERIDCLVDLLLTSVHFQETASTSATLSRAHVAETLAIVREEGGSVPRDVLRDRLALKQPNLTRVLEVMEAAGLIRREMRGRNCVVMLPEAEMAAAELPRETLVHVAAPTPPSDDSDWAVSDEELAEVLEAIAGEVRAHGTSATLSSGAGHRVRSEVQPRSGTAGAAGTAYVVSGTDRKQLIIDVPAAPADGRMAAWSSR